MQKQICYIINRIKIYIFIQKFDARRIEIMGRKLFDADPVVEELLSRYAKENGVKIGKKINQSIYNEFLPQEVQTLVIEANYILEQHISGNLDEKMIKQSLSRGVSWLKNYPIDDNQVIRSILMHYGNIPFDESQISRCNQLVKKLYKDVEAKLKEVDESYINYHFSLISLGDDICAHWKDVWKDSIMYEIISYMIYACDVKRPYDWYDCLYYLKQIEIAAMYRYNLNQLSRG